MGRVFDAIRKSSAADNGSGAKRQQPKDSQRRHEGSGVAGSPSAKEVEEQLFAGSTILAISNEAAPSSASSAHTADVPDGSALPAGIASRDAGATLDAAGATRAGGFVSYDISPARVEPHLVAISQPRSAYCEQFRSLRTRILQAGERLGMRALVVTSAGIAEGKTLTALNLGWLLAQTEGVRALVIDSDLRRPCATDYFGIEATGGLSEVLGGQIRLEDAIVRLDPAGLHLLPGFFCSCPIVRGRSFCGSPCGGWAETPIAVAIRTTAMPSADSLFSFFISTSKPELYWAPRPNRIIFTVSNRMIASKTSPWFLM